MSPSEPEAEIEDQLEAVVMLAHGMTIRMTADRSADPERIWGAFGLAVHKILNGGSV